jgi:hypothetical protein
MNHLKLSDLDPLLQWILFHSLLHLFLAHSLIHSFVYISFLLFLTLLLFIIFLLIFSLKKRRIGSNPDQIVSISLLYFLSSSFYYFLINFLSLLTLVTLKEGEWGKERIQPQNSLLPKSSIPFTCSSLYFKTLPSFFLQTHKQDLKNLNHLPL